MRSYGVERGVQRGVTLHSCGIKLRAHNCRYSSTFILHVAIHLTQHTEKSAYDVSLVHARGCVVCLLSDFGSTTSSWRVEERTVTCGCRTTTSFSASQESLCFVSGGMSTVPAPNREHRPDFYFETGDFNAACITFFVSRSWR